MSKKLEEYTKEELLTYIGKLRKDTKFGLVWNPKDEQVVVDCKTKIPVLQAVADRTIAKATSDEPTHLLMEGDNYHSLSVLNYTHAGKVDIIYIDPPYNTGNKDFIYNDHYVDKEDPYRHSEWLSFMDNRLRLAKNLLAGTGVIFISIDDNEQAHLKILCDTIFGEANFVGCLPRVTKKSGKQHSDDIASNHDYVLVYTKNRLLAQFRGIELDDDDYPFADEYEKDRGRYKLNQTLDYSSLFYNPAMDYKIEHDGQTFVPGGDLEKHYARHKGVHKKIDWVWRWGKDRFDFGVKNGFVVVKKSKNGSRIYTKTYSKATITKDNGHYKIEYLDRENNLSSLALVDNVFSNDNAKKELARILSLGDFDFPKPTSLVEQLMYITASKTAIILDFFAGSGTTGHAVLKLNAQDGGKRQFILGTNNENGIAENITYERINKVINGYNSTAGIPANVRYFKTQFVDTNGLSALTDKDKLEITKEMGAMIALRENSFNQVEQTDHWQTYENTTQVTGIYYREDKARIQEYLDKLNAQDKPVKLYVFGWGKNAGTEYASKKVNVEDIPEPLIEVYKEIAK